MQWNQAKFLFEVKPVLQRYQAENKWFSSWKDEDRDIQNAYSLYRCANEANLHFLLLGDTKIRKDPAIVGSFGLTSHGGVQESKERQMAELLQKERDKAGSKTGAVAPVVGAGGVLSDKNWTPLLNDAFVLGGIHAGWEFHLAEDDYKGFFAKRIGKAAFDARRAVFEKGIRAHPGVVTRMKWEEFFRENKQMVWDGFPRVFARELVGLKTFGYEPVYSESQLSFFRRSSGKANSASFLAYLNAAAGSGISPANSDKLLAFLSEFLFDRPDGFEKALKLE